MKSFATYILLFLFSIPALCQIDWSNIYFPNENAFGNYFIESYDNGYLLIGKHGPNSVEFNWLLKTDINGQILWNKTIGIEGYTINLTHIAMNKNGSLFSVGNTNYYDVYRDAIIMKFDSCGEKEWCKILYEPGLSYSKQVITNNDNGCTVLGYSPDEMAPGPVSLTRFSSDGEMLWNHYYLSPDSNISNTNQRSLIITDNNGYLLTGHCYYKDPNPPYLSWPKPYYIKVDSNGIFQWEQVLHKNVGSEAGGWAWSTVLNPDSNYYYSSISQYYPSSKTPTLVKLDMTGNVIDLYDIVEGFNYGGLGNSEFINDSVIICSIGWGNTEDDLKSYAAFIDTVGNIMDTAFLVQDIYTVVTDAVYDDKLAFMYNTYQSNQFDVHLVKFNMQLESDTFYTYPYQYDTLCPYSIPSDTIPIEGCDIIVGIHDYHEPVAEEDLMEVYPNPASYIVNIRYPISDIRNTILIYDTFGRLMDAIIVPSGQDGSQIDVSGYPNGIYVAVLRNDEKVLGRKKFVVGRE